MTVGQSAKDQLAPRRALQGRVALVTGVSRPIGIAYSLAHRLHEMGATVFATGWPSHDAEMPWGEQPTGATPFHLEQRSLDNAKQPHALVDAVFEQFGSLDIVVATHARSSSGSLLEVTADELDLCWAANVRSVLLLAQRFAARRERVGDEMTGRMIWFTSGQHLGPMPNELAYSVSKGALHQMTASVASTLSEHGIVANCINPGPVDTGYATGEAHKTVAKMFPGQRWGTPADVANLVAFLVSDEGGWINGQVINSEGGFARG
jgi:3-oxoacyl-[acyl-carrier protein] reductase